MDFKTSQTKTNLARAFAGECQAGARYQFLAEAATKAQQSQLAALMKLIATNEMAHARIFWNLLQKHQAETFFHVPIEGGYPFFTDDLLQGLQFESEIELSEHMNVYPSFARIAKDEGFADVAKAFTQIAQIELCHHMQLTEVGQKLSKNKLLKTPEPTKWKCMKCGHEETAKSAWSKCPVCDYDSGYVKIPLSDQ